MQEALFEAIETILATKFAAAGKRLMKRIREIDRLDELRLLLKASVSATTLQEMRDRLS